jgi:hypothetical protein
VLVLTLLEVDPTGKSSLDVGTVSLNLAEFASADPGAHAVRVLNVVALPAIVGARTARGGAGTRARGVRRHLFALRLLTRACSCACAAFVGVPKLRLEVGCRLRGAGGAPSGVGSSVADSADLGCEARER